MQPAVSETRRSPKMGSPHPELDEITVRRAQAGDRGAFRILVEHYQRPVFALLSRMLLPSGRGAQIEDVAQETFVRVHRALPRFGGDGRMRLGSWILTIAARLAVDELRRRGPGEPYDEASAGVGGPRGDEEAERRGVREAIADAVEQLSPEQRAAFLLREVHGLEYGAIAEALAIDLGTVKSRLSRARAALRRLLARFRDA